MDPSSIRVITTLGHVDHGKTTLMDALLAANNIISARMAGKMRYLDSREDEQERGITMESSAVSLSFQVASKSATGERQVTKYSINVIDTPGHVDFSSEVSTASRLCDGALIIVDVIEGVCTQTIAVLRQAWQDQLRPILVINKFDRLITELKQSPTEAYYHLARLIEEVNATMGSFFAAERMRDDERWREQLEARKNEAVDNNDLDAYEEKDDEDIYFSPDKGNVVFASALDGWGFRVGTFAQLFASKLGVKEANLRRVLWGDYYLDPKTKKFIGYKHLKGRPLKQLFIQLVLENIWAVYDAIILNSNPEKAEKIVQSLNIKVTPRELKSRDTKTLLTTIMSQWLSLSTSIIQAVIDVVPPPHVAQRKRFPKVFYPDLDEKDIQPQTILEKDIFESNAGDEACVAAFVSKMFAVSAKDLPEHKRKPLTGEEMRKRAAEARATATTNKDAAKEPENVSNGADGNDKGQEEQESNAETDAEAILGFGRIYSGNLKVGDKIFCTLPKYNAALEPSHPANQKYLASTTVEGLYIMMGRELEQVSSVGAGNIFAIRGLEGKVWRSATLCAPPRNNLERELDRSTVVNLGAVNRLTSPIVRVALEPEIPADMPKLVAGLRLLSQSDPCVQTFQQRTGEHVIVTAGELHLERCLKDLRERFAKVEIQASKPIVPYRETAIKAAEMLPSKAGDAPRGTVKGSSSQGLVKFIIRAVPLPHQIQAVLQGNTEVLKKLQTEQNVSNSAATPEHGFEDDVELEPTLASSSQTTTPEQFWEQFQKACSEAGDIWRDIPDTVWAFGPQNVGECILVDMRSQPVQHKFVGRDNSRGTTNALDVEFDHYVETGFQLATLQGPLCAEPMQGMAFLLENIQIDSEAIEKEREQNRLAQVTGSLISAVRDACRNGLLDWSPRLMLAMYSCDIQASTEVLGKVYGVVAKRRGRIVAEEMKEGTAFFNISALLPVVESFGFADDIRKKTSGAASPQLIFHGFEMLDQDPFWVPTTEEELEDLGEKADRINIAKSYMDTIRERKGMFVDRKIVEFAEKQRTLKK